MQPCKTGDQPYSDASPYSECSLKRVILLTNYETLRMLPIRHSVGLANHKALSLKKEFSTSSEPSFSKPVYAILQIFLFLVETGGSIG